MYQFFIRFRDKAANNAEFNTTHDVANFHGEEQQ